MAKSPKQFYFKIIFFLLIAAVTLGACECVAAFFTPSWPAMGLHGQMPEFQKRSWMEKKFAKGSSEINSWGERDKERSRHPVKGIERIVFVGDSFLEESGAEPISLKTEEKLSGTEVLNLGVSATDPDEYYFRVKNIVLPLGAKRCYLFFYEGNDFIQQPTLKSWWGIAAVYPRDSLLVWLGLRSINHLFTNRERPLTKIWGQAGELAGQEDRFWQLIKKSDDSKLKLLLAYTVPENFRKKIYGLLQKKDLTRFFEVLRDPDGGLFRSYYLKAALKYLAQDGRPFEIKEDFAYDWVKKTYEICRRHGLEFTLVIIPEAFGVDTRMRDQWLPLTDMKEVFANQRAASHRMKHAAMREGMDVLDLRDTLDGQEGSYLNMDGHWSDKGVDLVSARLAEHIQNGSRSHG